MNIINSSVSFQNLNFTHRISNILTFLQKKTIFIGLIIIGGLSLCCVAYSFLKSKKIKPIKKKSHQYADETQKTKTQNESLTKTVIKTSSTTKKLVSTSNPKKSANLSLTDPKISLEKIALKSSETIKAASAKIDSPLLEIEKNKHETHETIPVIQIKKEDNQKNKEFSQVSEKIISGKLHVGKFIDGRLIEGVIYRDLDKKIKFMEGSFSYEDSLQFLQGQGKTYNEKGELIFSGTFDKGVPVEGKEYKEGKLFFQGFFNLNQKKGSVFSSDGKLKYSGELNNNYVYNGLGSEYDKQGKVVEKDGIFENGVLKEGTRFSNFEGGDYMHKDVGEFENDQTWTGSRYELDNDLESDYYCEYFLIEEGLFKNDVLAIGKTYNRNGEIVSHKYQ